MSRNLWDDDKAAAAAAVAPGNADGARKAMFPTIAGNLWMSHGEETWTADSAGNLSGGRLLMSIDIVTDCISQEGKAIISIRACLDQHSITIRSLEVLGDHVQSKT